MKLIEIVPRDLFDETVNIYQFFKLYYCFKQSPSDFDGTINSIQGVTRFRFRIWLANQFFLEELISLNKNFFGFDV